jgi:hypothetical protein
MFFNKEKKQIEAMIALLDRLEFKIEALQSTNVRYSNYVLDALVKAYPNGVNKDGQPRKKIGRPHKKVTA